MGNPCWIGCLWVIKNDSIVKLRAVKTIVLNHLIYSDVFTKTNLEWKLLGQNLFMQTLRYEQDVTQGQSKAGFYSLFSFS